MPRFHLLDRHPGDLLQIQPITAFRHASPFGALGRNSECAEDERVDIGITGHANSDITFCSIDHIEAEPAHSDRVRPPRLSTRSRPKRHELQI
jgi:hypothetical protein